MLHAILNFLASLFSALSRAADASTPDPVPTVDTQSAAPPGWEGGPPYRFVDVSRWQGKITLDGWRKVKAAGYKGVMLRAVGNRNGVPYIDPTFEDNYANAKAAGLDVGVYYYTNASCEKLADEELAVLRQALRGKKLTMPVAVDVEDNELKQLGRQALTDLTAYALARIEAMGFYAQLYTYTSFANTRLSMGGAALSPYDVWLADYTGKPPAVTFKYNAHQHTSKGAVPGISGDVDLNVTTLNYPKIIEKKGLTRLREGV